MKKTIFTIGYAGFSEISDFLKELKQNRINYIIDVRSIPYSKYHLSYNRENIKKILNDKGIRYENFDKEFGARQMDSKLQVNGKVSFQLFSNSDIFKSGVEKVEKIINDGYNICFMCTEVEPRFCHRGILISRVFYNKGYSIIHLITKKPSLTQEELEKNMLNDFFPDRREIPIYSDEKYLEMTYKLQEDQISFRSDIDFEEYYKNNRRKI